MIANNQPNKNTKNTNCNRHNARSFYPLLETSISISYTLFIHLMFVRLLTIQLVRLIRLDAEDS